MQKVTKKWQYKVLKVTKKFKSLNIISDSNFHFKKPIQPGVDRGQNQQRYTIYGRLKVGHPN